MEVRSLKGAKNTRRKILLKISIYYSILKTFLFCISGKWFLNSYFFIAVFENCFFFFFFPPGGRQREKPGHV